ncbi:MAG: hypothetical protein Q4F66_09290 [Clostridium sp.]|nr:hypothetical protein [Clostridium sp.]
MIIEVKKKRAEMILKYYKDLTPRNGPYTPELLEAKRQFYEEFLTLK